MFSDTWSKDLTATPHSPPFPDFLSRSPTQNLLGSQFGPFGPGCPGRRWGPFPCSMPFHFLSLRTSQISSQGHGSDWDSPLTTHAPLVSLPLSRAYSQALALALPCPLPPYPPEGAGGCLGETGILCLIMEQALGNESAPGRACSVSGTLANDIVPSQLTEEPL